MSRGNKTPDEEVIRSVMEVYERGLTVDALKRAEAFAPLEEWAGAKPCVLAARLAANSGAPRLSTRLTVRARRSAPNDPETLAQYGYDLLGRRGPLAVWQLLRDWKEDGAESDVKQQAELLALKGLAASDLLDFTTAESLIGRAETLDPSSAWIRLQRAHLLERLDRVEEALETAASARTLHLHPFYRPAVQASAHLLQLLDRDEEAIQLLTDANQFLQNAPLAAQLYALLSENGRWVEAEATLDRFKTLAIRLERPLRRWVTAQLARVAYHLERRADAKKLATELDDAFHRSFAEKLGVASMPGGRIQLDVTFVRQHFKTCAPATLAALGRFWHMPAEHVKLAEAMCYDGTPHWQQRDWAENHGWHVRDFRVTMESARALLQRGLPFAVTTVDATSAHMMAVIGFDQIRGALLLRDPSQPYTIEVPHEEFLRRYRPFGPLGTVFLPLNERARLNGLVLPDADGYDQYHQFWLALVKHDRATAAEVVRQMHAAFADHPLTWEAKFDLAVYDVNHTEQMRCLDRLLELFPGNAARLLRRLGCLRDSPRQERLSFLEQACATKDAEPALCVELARALAADARALPKARSWLKRATRRRPSGSGGVSVEADICWAEGNLEEATELYRFAATLEAYLEPLYQSWFLACRRTRRTDEAMAHLRDRFARFGSRSEQPALTLAWAYREMEQPGQAWEVLQEAAKLRPDDAGLLLRSAGFATTIGKREETDSLLQAARGRVRENDWLRAAAEIAEMRSDISTALRLARELLRLEPLALDAHGGVVRSLARLEGQSSALMHLEEACAQSPHHLGLQRMLVEWSRGAGTQAVEDAARAMLEADPADAWARRELAAVLAKSNRRQAALKEAEEAARIEPRNSFSYSILGHVHQELEQWSQARMQFRRAVELSADNSDALHALLGLAGTDPDRKEELAFIEQQLTEQVVIGDGLLAFLELARPIQDPQALLQSIRMAHEARPDLWHVWSALVSQLGHLGQLSEARDRAAEATERFPYLPRAWLDLAQVHRWRNEPDEEIAAAERAFEINPAWNSATLALTDALERRGRLDAAQRIFERALLHSATDPQLHASQAHLLWRLRQPEAAFAAVERALRLAPGFDWAWALLLDWAASSGQAERPATFARGLTQERRGEMWTWLMLARVLKSPAEKAERLAAVERGLELDPGSVEAWDLKAELLAQDERFQDAIQACEEGIAACATEVHVLRGRRAWIEAQRRRLPDAVCLMRTVLAENASYAWGWSQLAHWLTEQKNWVEAAATLEHMRQLRPRDPWALRQLGVLRLRQNERAQAQEAFDAALRLSPTDACAAHSIFDLQLQAGDLSGAASTLRVMQTHQPGAPTLAAEVLLLLSNREWSGADKALRALCQSPDPDPWAINVATEAFERGGWSTRVAWVLKDALAKRPCHPQVGAAVIRVLLNQRKGLAAVRLFLRLAPGELQTRAAVPLVQGLAAQNSRVLLWWLLRRRREVFAQNDDAWGQVGFALSQFNRQKQVVEWLADWQTRPNAQPWMLFNLCLAFRDLGRYEEGNVLARHVVDTWGHREGSAGLRLFLGVEDALAGDLESASLHLKLAVARKDVPHDQALLALAQAILEFRQTPVAERARQSRTIRQTLARRLSAWALFRSKKDVRRTFQRAGDVFTREGGGRLAYWWVVWRLNWQWLLLLVSPLLLLVVAPRLTLLAALLIGVWVWAATRGRKK